MPFGFKFKFYYFIDYLYVRLAEGDTGDILEAKGDEQKYVKRFC